MNPAIPINPNTEELSPGLYDQMGVYAPFVWMMDWVVVYVLRLSIKAGFIDPEFLMPSRPEIKPVMFTRNRQLRRGRASCMKRVRRHALKGRRINPEDYTPRAYAYYGYLDRMDKTITPAQFNERYLRDNNISRMQIYGMDSAHEITGFATGVGENLLGALKNLLDVSSMKFGTLSDPAPP